MRIEDTFVCTRSYLENLRIREGADVDPFESGTILLLDRSNMTRTHIDAYFAEHGIEPKQILEATTMDLLIEFAKTGLGIGCDPRVCAGRIKGWFADRTPAGSANPKPDDWICLSSVGDDADDE